MALRHLLQIPIFSALLLTSPALAAPEIRVIVPRPGALAPKLGPWLVLFGDVLPAIHPRSLSRTFAEAGFDPLLPSTWPKGAGQGPLALSGTPEQWIDLASGETAEAWRARFSPSASRPAGDLRITAKALEGIDSLEGRVDLKDTILEHDLQVVPKDRAEAWALVGSGPSRPLIEIEGVIAEVSGTFATLLSEVVGIAVDAGLKGPAQIALLEDGALIVAFEIDPRRATPILEGLGDREKKALGPLVVWGWPGASGNHLDAVRLAAKGKRPALYARVTTRALLASLEGRSSSRKGPRLEGSELMVLQLAAGRALSAIDSIQIEAERRRGGVRVRGRWSKIGQKP